MNSTEFLSCEVPLVRRQTHKTENGWWVPRAGGGGGSSYLLGSLVRHCWSGSAQHTEVAQMYLLCELIMHV